MLAKTNAPFHMRARGQPVWADTANAKNLENSAPADLQNASQGLQTPQIV